MSTILWADGFEDWITAGHGYSFGSNAGTNTSFGRFGGRGMSIAGDATITRDLSANYTECWMGAAYRINAAPATYFHGIGIGFGAAFPAVAFQATSDRRLQAITINASNTLAVLGGSAPFAFSIGVYFHLSTRFIWGPGGVGRVTAYLNETPLFDLIGVDTQTTRGAQGFHTLWQGRPSNVDMDDWWATDTENLGDCRIVSLLPTGVSPTGAEDQFVIGGTAPAGTKVASVNEVNPNGGVTLVRGSTVGDTQLFTMQPLTVAGSIKGAMVWNYAAKGDASTCDGQNAIKTGGIITLGAQKPLSPTYDGYPTTFRLDPATGLDFTTAAINAALVGMRKAA